MGLENPIHLAIILVVVLLVFGAKRVPEVGRSLGKGIREFKESITGEEEPRAIAPAAPAAPAEPPVPAAVQSPSEPEAPVAPPGEPPAAPVAGPPAQG